MRNNVEDKEQNCAYTYLNIYVNHATAKYQYITLLHIQLNIKCAQMKTVKLTKCNQSLQFKENNSTQEM